MALSIGPADFAFGRCSTGGIEFDIMPFESLSHRVWFKDAPLFAEWPRSAGARNPTALGHRWAGKPARRSSPDRERAGRGEAPLTPACLKPYASGSSQGRGPEGDGRRRQGTQARGVPDNQSLRPSEVTRRRAPIGSIPPQTSRHGQTPRCEMRA